MSDLLFKPSRKATIFGNESKEANGIHNANHADSSKWKKSPPTMFFKQSAFSSKERTSSTSSEGGNKPECIKSAKRADASEDFFAKSKDFYLRSSSQRLNAVEETPSALRRIESSRNLPTEIEDQNRTHSSPSTVHLPAALNFPTNNSSKNPSSDNADVEFLKQEDLELEEQPQTTPPTRAEKGQKAKSAEPELQEAPTANEALSAKLSTACTTLLKLVCDLKHTESVSQSKDEAQIQNVEHLSRLYKHLELQFKDAQDWQSQINEKSHDVWTGYDISRGAIDELEQEIRSMVVFMRDVDALHGNFASAKNELELEIQKMRLDRSQKAKLISELQANLDELKLSKQSVEGTLREEMERLQSCNSALVAELEDALGEARRDKSILQKKLEELENINREKSAAFEVLSTAKDTALEAKVQAERDRENLEHAFQLLKSSETELREEIQNVKLELDKLKGEHDCLNAKHRELELAHSQSLSAAKAFDNGNSILREQLAEEKKVVDFLRRNLEDISNQIELVRSQYRNELASTKDILKQTQAEHIDLRSKYDSKKEAYAALEAKSKEAMESMSCTKATLEKQLEEAHSSIGEHLQSIETMRQQLANLKGTNRELAALKDVFRDTSAKLETLESKSTMMADRAASLMAENAKLEATVSCQRNLVENLQITIASFEHEKTERASDSLELESLRNQLSKVASQLTSVRSVVQEALSSKDDIFQLINKSKDEVCASFEGLEQSRKDCSEKQYNAINSCLVEVNDLKKNCLEKFMGSKDRDIENLKNAAKESNEVMVAKLDEANRELGSYKERALLYDKVVAQLADTKSALERESKLSLEQKNAIKKLQENIEALEKSKRSCAALGTELEELKLRESKWQACLDESRLTFQNQVSSLSSQLASVKHSEQQLRDSLLQLQQERRSKSDTEKKLLDTEERLYDAQLELEALKSQRVSKDKDTDSLIKEFDDVKATNAKSPFSKAVHLQEVPPTPSPTPNSESNPTRQGKKIELDSVKSTPQSSHVQTRGKRASSSSCSSSRQAKKAFKPVPLSQSVATPASRTRAASLKLKSTKGEDGNVLGSDELCDDLFKEVW